MRSLVSAVFRALVAVLAFFGMAVAAHASPNDVLKLNTPQPVRSITHVSHLSIDQAGELETHEFLAQARAGTLTPIETPMLRLPISGATYWIHTAVENEGAAGSWIFEL